MTTLAREISKSADYKFRDNLRVVSRIFLLRHALSVANDSGVLAGQISGISLSKSGQEQAEKLVERIGPVKFDSVRVSPMQRCQETIAPWVASSYGSGIGQYLLDDQVIEMDYGTWSGKKLSKLSRNKLWKEIQSSPSKVTFPGGEKFTAMQKRSFMTIRELGAAKKGSNHLVVSHGDVIKAIVASCLKMKLDDFQSLIIDPASVTVIDFDGSTSRLIAYNDKTSDFAKFMQSPKSMKALLGGGAGVKAKRSK
jgi:probable phosphomutase (TIGR03848 family)